MHEKEIICLLHYSKRTSDNQFILGQIEKVCLHHVHAYINRSDTAHNTTLSTLSSNS